MRIGFVGLGRMGMAMTARLRAQGFALTVWNRTVREGPEGIAVAGSLGELVNASDVVFSMLIDDAATMEVHETMFAGDVAGKLFVEMGTMRLDTVQRLAQMAGVRGARFADAPVVGTVAPALQGKLMVLVGGDAGIVEMLTPMLDAFSRRIVHCGRVGAGMAMKHCVNNVMSVYFAGLAEAIGAGAAAGLSLDRMLDVLLDTPAALPALGPKVDVIKGAEPPVAFSVAGACKDMRVIAASGQANGVAMRVTESALATFAEVANSGMADKDLAVVVRRYLTSGGNDKPAQ